MVNPTYIKSDGKIYEVVGYDGRYPVTRLTDLKEIPVDKPLKKVETKEEVVEDNPVEEVVVKPKRTRKK